MQQPVEAPTPKALADLVARCDQINRFETQLTAAEEGRITALASGILVMRQVLELPLVGPDQLPDDRQAASPPESSDTGQSKALHRGLEVAAVGRRS